MIKKINLLIALILSSIVLSCNSANDIIHDNIKIENGVYADCITHEVLDEEYRCVNKRTVIQLEYDNGRPINSWKEFNNNELIHSGHYILEPKVSQEIKTLTESFRVDLNLWSEVDYYTLNIELITPQVISPSKQEEITTLIDNDLLPRYKFEGVRIRIIEPSSTKTTVLR
jgi:hypothetical protein